MCLSRRRLFRRPVHFRKVEVTHAMAGIVSLLRTNQTVELTCGSNASIKPLRFSQNNLKQPRGGSIRRGRCQPPQSRTPLRYTISSLPCRVQQFLAILPSQYCVDKRRFSAQVARRSREEWKQLKGRISYGNTHQHLRLKDRTCDCRSATF